MFITENGAKKIKFKQNIMIHYKPNPATTTLYSSFESVESHCVRFIIAEKLIPCDVFNIKIEDMPEEILELNPYQMLPTLYDKGLVLYDLPTILEYLDERFPFPPLMPVDSILRAEKRMLLFRFNRAENNWYSLAARILKPKSTQDQNKARILLTSNLIELVPVFAYKPYFKSNSFGIVDACLAPVLWRLEKMKIKLPASARVILEYSEKLFARKSFHNSLTDAEKEYRK